MQEESEVQRELWFSVCYTPNARHAINKLMTPSKKNLVSLIFFFLAVWAIISKLVLIKQSNHLPKSFVKKLSSSSFKQKEIQAGGVVVIHEM